MSPVVVHDLPTRLMHWALAVCIVLNLFILEEGDPPHTWVGYTAVAIVAIRAFWGFLQSRRGFKWRGPNRLATALYLLFWLMVIALAVTGWMMGLDKYWGEEWLEEIHESISVGVQVYIGLHLMGIAIDSIHHKRKTWMGMIK